MSVEVGQTYRAIGELTANGIESCKSVVGSLHWANAVSAVQIRLSHRDRIGFRPLGKPGFVTGSLARLADRDLGCNNL